MAILYRWTLTVVFAVVVALLSTFVESQEYGICANQFVQSCNEANTTAGAIKCCSWISQEYSTDKSCLCYIFGAAELNNSAELKVLDACGVDTTGVGTVCVGSPTPPGHLPSPTTSSAHPTPPGSNGYPQPPTTSKAPPPSGPTLLPLFHFFPIDNLPPHSHESPLSPSDYTPTSPPPTDSNVYLPKLLAPPQPQYPRIFSSAAIAGIAGGGAVLLIVAGVSLFLFLRRRPRPATQLPLVGPAIGDGTTMTSRTIIFKYDELVKATEGFPDSKLLGEGGFGFVHKGVLPNGKEVAVKQLRADSGQGEREFRAEVEIISSVHHRHLVSLVGYCVKKQKRLLVYDFVPNGTLEIHLHGIGNPTMEWATRYKVALGSAKGLAYLHEDCHPKIIHRDIKASNILLDYNFEPLVADFGLAKFSSEKNTHVTTRVMGTFGYLAPDYAASGKLTEKSDVFSFGVVLLELITGRRPTDKVHSSLDDECLVDWARPLLTKALESNNYQILVDKRLHNYDHYQMERVVACAAACVRNSARLRPRMSQIVRVLEGEVLMEELNQHLTPGFSGVHRSHIHVISTSDSSASTSKNITSETSLSADDN